MIWTLSATIIDSKMLGANPAIGVSTGEIQPKKPNVLTKQAVISKKVATVPLSLFKNKTKPKKSVHN